MWFRVASVVHEMFHVVSCGQCGTRDVSCGFVWPMWQLTCFMWFRVASVDVVLCGLCGTRDVACCFERRA